MRAWLRRAVWLPVGDWLFAGSSALFIGDPPPPWHGPDDVL